MLLVFFNKCVQLGKFGSASYKHSEDGTKDVDLMTKKCIIFLITGIFRVREKVMGTD